MLNFNIKMTTIVAKIEKLKNIIKFFINFYQKDKKMTDQKKEVENTSKLTNLEVWFYDLITQKIPIYRAFTVDRETALKLFDELKKLSFQEWQIPAAEEWILQGDWTYKSKHLTINDFFPKAEQIKGIDAFISLEKHLQILENTRRTSEENFKRFMDNEILISNKKEYAFYLKKTKFFNDNMIAMQQQIVNLKDEIVKLNIKIEEMKHKEERLLDKIRSLQG